VPNVEPCVSNLWMDLDYMVKLHHMDENGRYGWNLNIWMEPNNVKQIDKNMYETNNIKTFNYVDGVNHEYHMDVLIWWHMDKTVFIAEVGHAYVILTPWIKLRTCMKSITWMKLNALIAILHVDETICIQYGHFHRCHQCSFVRPIIFMWSMSYISSNYMRCYLLSLFCQFHTFSLLMIKYVFQFSFMWHISIWELHLYDWFYLDGNFHPWYCFIDMVTPFVSSIPPLKLTSIHVTNYIYVINFILEHDFIHLCKSIFGLYYIHNNWLIL